MHEDDSNCGATGHGGVEYGVYHWNQTTHEFALVNAVVDTNTDCGIANDGVTSPAGTLVKNQDGTLTLESTDTNGGGVQSVSTLTPVTSNSGSLIGSWGNNQFFTVYGADGTIFSADIRFLSQLNTTSPGIEDGCYLLSGSTAAGSYTENLSGTCAVSGTQTGADTNGASWGSSAFGSQPWLFGVAGDSMQLTLPGAAFPGTLNRITTN